MDRWDDQRTGERHEVFGIRFSFRMSIITYPSTIKARRETFEEVTVSERCLDEATGARG